VVWLCDGCLPCAAPWFRLLLLLLLPLPPPPLLPLPPPPLLLLLLLLPLKLGWQRPTCVDVWGHDKYPAVGSGWAVTSTLLARVM
jgi:hypothetical protein